MPPDPMAAVKSLALGALILVLLAGGAALAYARWTGPIAEGDRASADGRLEQALAAYAHAEARFDRVGAAKQLFAGDYTRVIDNELWALYRLGRYDDTIEKADRAPDGAQPHFWAGCAFFEKALAEDKPEARLGWLNRAEEELRRAVEAAPDDWDTKYDFELVTRLAAELRKQPKTPPNQLMQLLRPQPKAGAKPARRVG
jgi:tetratricopeptide (TPR) repeat protein